MTKPTSRAEAALQELCVRLGYCLSADAADELLRNPPGDPEQFADAVLIAEGLDSDIFDRRKRAEVVEVVREWLFDDVGRGAKSQLPLFPS